MVIGLGAAGRRLLKGLLFMRSGGAWWARTIMETGAAALMYTRPGSVPNQVVARPARAERHAQSLGCACPSNVGRVGPAPGRNGLTSGLGRDGEVSVRLW